VKKEKTITLTVTAYSKEKGYLNGSKSVTITVKPLDDDGQGKEKNEDNLIEEMSKPKYFLFWIIVVLLLFITIIIFTLLIRTKKKLKMLEQGTEDIGKSKSTKKKAKKQEQEQGHKDERVSIPSTEKSTIKEVNPKTKTKKSAKSKQTQTQPPNTTKQKPKP
jgi:ABC-type Na+ efflux pump permease subunit